LLFTDMLKSTSALSCQVGITCCLMLVEEALLLFTVGWLGFSSVYCQVEEDTLLVTARWKGALTFSPPAFGPCDNSTRTFRSMDTGSPLFTAPCDLEKYFWLFTARRIDPWYIMFASW
jgi:hypothetical protein